MRSAILALALSSAAIATAQSGNTDSQSDQPLELSIFFQPWAGAPGYDEGWPVEQRAREMTGVYLKDFDIPGPGNDRSSALSTIIDSNTFPDILGGFGIRDTVNHLGPQGAFYPLDELIENNAPNIKAFLKERSELMRSVRAHDGKLYHIPAFPVGEGGRAWFIRQDWLDKLGLDPPQTVDELHDVLAAFKTRDPNGNGLADEIPYFARDASELERLVTLWDGRSSGSEHRADFRIENNEIVHGYTTEAFRTGIEISPNGIARG